MEKLRKIRTICTREEWLNATLWQIQREGDRLVLGGGKDSIGFACLPRIDSREAGFRWSRGWLEGDFPEGTVIRVYSYVSDDPTVNGRDFSELLRYLVYDSTPLDTVRGIFGEPVSQGTDFLISGQGRYLWLMVELGVTTEARPAISALRVQMAADHMTDYLPAIYQGDDFTYRFLSVFDSMVSDLEQQIELLPERLDPRHTRDDMLKCMAELLNLSPEGDREKLCRMIDTAVGDYETMYSLEGVHRSIRRLTGRDALLIEGKDVDPNCPENGDSASLRCLYGENPYRFFALMEEDTFPSRQAMETFLEKMRSSLPAGVEMELVLLKKCVQLGWYTYMGINTVLEGYVPAMIDENTSIHFDTMIGGNP